MGADNLGKRGFESKARELGCIGMTYLKRRPLMYDLAGAHVIVELASIEIDTTCGATV